jgi:cellulose synthase/poly-beta-1,6-N-acetylglucosamine synthase-like glycosyltransferase
LISYIVYSVLTLCVLGILHTYVFYPALLLLFAPKKPKTSPGNFTASVGILVAAYNEEKVIAGKLQSILDSDFPLENVHIYIGSDASTDRTNAIVEEFSRKNNIHLTVFPGRTGKAAIINRLAEECKEDIFILTDANVLFEKNTIKNLVRHFSDMQVHQVCSNIVKVSDKKISIQPIEQNYLNLENRIKSLESNAWQLVIGAEGGCYAIRRNKYVPVPKNYFMDDFFVTMGVIDNGGKVLFDTEAICFEDLPSESSEEFKRKVRISIGNYQNLSSYKHLLWPPWTAVAFAFFSHKVLRWITPFLLFIIYACSLYLAFHSRLFLGLSVLQLFLFMLPLFINAIDSIKPLLFVAHFYNMNYALLKGFIMYTKGVRSSVWEPTKRHA